jgi:A/G-specific adenine glycosylase
MDRFPTVADLAAAEETDVLKLWEGLGYYRRARQLHAAAGIIMAEHAGKFPTEFSQVLALPGIGRYTAGAILSIALGRRLPILEGNTIRLFARLLALRTDPRVTANQRRLWEFAEQILPKSRVGDFNQALMEVGNQICSPQNPACDRCPLIADCGAFALGLQASIPQANKKMKYESISEAVVLVPRRGKYLVRRCQPDERWAGLWDFLRFRIAEPGNAEVQQAICKQLREQFGLEAQLRPSGATIKHAVTRYRITLDCFIAESVGGRLKTAGQDLQWLSLDEIEGLAMSITGRKIARRLMQQTG